MPIDRRHISEWSDAELAEHARELAARDFVDGFSRAALLELVTRVDSLLAALATAREPTSGPKGSFGYCAGCYHPLDRCSHCDAPDGIQWRSHYEAAMFRWNEAQTEVRRLRCVLDKIEQHLEPIASAGSAALALQEIRNSRHPPSAEAALATAQRELRETRGIARGLEDVIAGRVTRTVVIGEPEDHEYRSGSNQAGGLPHDPDNPRCPCDSCDPVGSV